MSRGPLARGGTVMEPRFVVGIDLGTTHSVLAASPLARPAVRLFEVPQLVAPGEVVARELLPSFLYLPAPGEFAPADLRLPWGTSDVVVGELARSLGARSPSRLVASAKSWICHGGVNRRAPILPWSAPDPEPHVSPFDASVRYLAHLRASWEASHPTAPLAAQDVVVTVPASFDDDSRALTLDAARAAGLGAVHLLEEPQAAFYDFLGQHAADLAARLGDARLVLVVDVGGGTTDLTLLEAKPAGEPAADGRPRLERIAVGGHLLLGGDNMDAALAHHVLGKAGIERKLDPTEWSALVQSARTAKERLLAADPAPEAVVSVQSRGSRLVGGTRSVTLSREEVNRVLLDGFVPFTGPTEVASRAGRSGLTTLGLPYATDPAIPRHVCAFLRRHAGAATAAGARVRDGLPRPDLLLLNGGVFNAPAMVERLSQVLAGWYGGESIALLEHTSLDTAVAAGAARYALARRGLGEVIGGGAARAYYLGVEGPAGEPRALCVAPRGIEEGATVRVPGRVFELVLDRPVAFPLYSYSGDRRDAAGAVIAMDPELEPLPPVETVLRARGGVSAEAGVVPVTVSATLNESGVLELYLVTVALPPHRWKLELELGGGAAGTPGSAGGGAAARAGGAGAGAAGGAGAGGAGAPAPGEAANADLAAAGGRSRRPESRVGEGRTLVERAFAPGGDAAGDRAKGLRAALEGVLGPRGTWPAETCRVLADACLGRASARTRSALHELNWLRLTSWCLRPGFGAPGDADRVRRVWTLHGDGLAHPTKASWAEWWILWRRLAAGLDAAQQQAVFEDVSPWLSPAANTPPGPRPGGPVEMLQLLAALERLPAAEKVAAGEWFLARAAKLGSWWPLGRLGAREPFHGDAGDVVAPAVAEQWLGRVLGLDWKKTDGASFAAALLARMTGDPRRDVSAELRATVAARLREAAAPATWVDMVTRPTALSAGDEGRLVGDALPVGLRLR